MALVLCATQAWGVVTDTAGNVRRDLPVSFDVPLYSDADGTVPITSPKTDSKGRIPGYVESGTRTVTYDGQTLSVEAVSAELIAALSTSVDRIVSSAVGNGVADATTTIQEELDTVNDAGGGRVFIPSGTYLITTALQIGSNTILELSPRATIRRNAPIDNMLRNKADGATGAYGAASNIEVRGGTWDCNGANFASNVCGFAFGHAEYVTVAGVTIKGAYGYHAMEVNAVRHAVIRNCVFRDFDAVSTNKEFVQIDVATLAGFPWFGPYDNTACDDVLVQGCVFQNGCRGVGTHSGASGKFQSNVRIADCHFSDLREQAVALCDMQQVIVKGCTFVNCAGGVKAETAALQVCKGFVISGNVFDMKGRANSRAIQFVGSNTANRYMRDITVDGNVVRGAASHAIGFDYCNGVTVCGNYTDNPGGAGLWIFQTVNATVANNVLRTSALQDLIIGNTSGAATDTQDVICQGNRADVFRVNWADRVIVTNNTWGSEAASGGTPTNVQRLGNFVANVWAA